MSEIPISTIHFFSQLAYLDTAPAMEENGVFTVGALCEYYLSDPVGKLYLWNRFGDIPREYRHWLDMLKSHGAPYKGWRIADIFDDNKPSQSGFYGCSYISPGNFRVVSFRGSELLGNRYYENDYVTDFGLAYMPKTPQQSKVDEYWERFGPNINSNFALTGHSLGGNLAVYGIITAPPGVRERIGVCAAFNAPGFNREFIHEHKADIEAVSGRIRLIQNKYDPVSSMLENVSEPEIVESEFEPPAIKKPSAADIFYPHSNFMYKKNSEGEFIPSADNEKCSFCKTVHRQTDVLLLLPTRLREELSKAVLAAFYAAPSQQNAERYMLDAALKYISQNGEFPGNSELEELLRPAGALEEFKDVSEPYRSILSSPDAGGSLISSKSLFVLLSILADIFKRVKKLRGA